MSQINPSLPIVGQLNSGEEPKIPIALSQILSVINGNLDYTNLAATVDQYYKTIREERAISQTTPAATYVFAPGVQDANSVARQGALTAVGANNAGLGVFYLDPAHYPTASPRTNKIRIAVSVMVNATAPAITYTYGLYPVTAVAGGAQAVTVTLGTVVAGSTVAIASPGASSTNHGESTDIAFPSAGYYALGVVLSGIESGITCVAHRVALQTRAT
jgi:hypothetical protein